MDKVQRSEAEWRALLTPEQYEVLRERGTEPAWSGDLLDAHEPGTFRCAACGADLFRSEAKFESGSGWPSFFSSSSPTRTPARRHSLRRSCCR